MKNTTMEDLQNRITLLSMSHKPYDGSNSLRIVETMKRRDELFQSFRQSMSLLQTLSMMTKTPYVRTSVEARLAQERLAAQAQPQQRVV